MEFKAYKMDGLGNDFVIIDQRIENIQLSKDQIVKICDRNFIGCDQLIFIKKNDKLDANLEFYNSDGSFSGACGNGTRCVAYLLSKEKNKSSIDVQTSSGILNSKILKDNGVKDVYVAATHGVFPETSIESIINSKEIKEVVVTNSLPINYKSEKLKILSISELFGEAIKRTNRGDSVGALFL